MSQDDQLKGFDAIGEAWLDENGTIHLDLSRTSQGQNVNGFFTYPRTHPSYQEILRHLEGLEPGIKKLVPPWK